MNYSEKLSQKTKIEEKSFVKKISMRILSLVLIVAGLYLCYLSWEKGSFWIFLGALLVFLFSVVFWAYSEPSHICPNYKNEFITFEKNQYNECSKCGLYSKANSEYTTLIPDDTVANNPCFKSKIPSGSFTWPNQNCCLCDNPASRLLEIIYEDKHNGKKLAEKAVGLAFGVYVIHNGGSTIHSIKVPHCDMHENGVKIEDKNTILFASYSYRNAFQEANNIKG